MVYEKLHEEECPNPMLLKFIGKPEDLSPKAWIKTWFGWPMPFDRHDWTVDRQGQHVRTTLTLILTLIILSPHLITPPLTLNQISSPQVRYIIDYYHDEEEAGDKRPGLHDRGAMKSITLDVRPALDSFGAFQDRCVILYRELTAAKEEEKIVSKEEEMAPEVIDLDWKKKDGLDPDDYKLYRKNLPFHTLSYPLIPSHTLSYPLIPFHTLSCPLTLSPSHPLTL